MKGLSLFFLKNSMGANMKKTFRNSCKGEASTSTVPSFSETADHSSTITNDPPRKSVTLEEMILQLELEEERARRANENLIPRRMSCVNNSDILRSARNALNQYPRFSLDGKEAMYRSSFGKQVDRREGLAQQRKLVRSSNFGGESVVWCNPGVVARLMGLETIPVPVGRMMMRKGRKEEGVLWSRNPRRRERTKEVCSSSSSSRKNGHCVMMRPISSLEAVGEEGRRASSWQPTHVFL